MIKYYPYKSDKPNKKYYIITKDNKIFILGRLVILIARLAGALSFGLSQVGLGLICTAVVTAPGGIVPRPMRARPVHTPTQPTNGTGQPRTGCSSHDIPLGAARPTLRASAARADSATDPVRG